MKQFFLIATILAAFYLTSCKESTKEENTTTPSPTEKTETPAADEIVTSTATDASGKVLEMSFNNTKDIATVKFNGETIELTGQKPASGIWYKNDHYELRGKGEAVELTKDGTTVFKN